MTSNNLTGIDTLYPERIQIVQDAINNVLATEHALYTYAQIIDGLPLSQQADLYNFGRLRRAHPILLHEQFCPGVIEAAKDHRAGFNVNSLAFEQEVLQRFQLAPRQSRQFKLRLIELTAAAIHQIAVYLFLQKHHLHDTSTTNGYDVQGVTQWQRPFSSESSLPKIDYRPTLFMHEGFPASEQYPNGLADCVGYWAEDCIFGGVSLFDHSQLWTDEDNEPNVYFQCGRAGVTFRICQLLDGQLAEFVDFLTAGPRTAARLADSCPLPILPGMENRTRIDPDKAVIDHKVYRNTWERRPPKAVDPVTAYCQSRRRWNQKYYAEEGDVEGEMKILEDLAKEQDDNHQKQQDQ